MALLFMDGFDHYNTKSYPTTKWDLELSSSYSTYLPAGGRRGSGCILVSRDYGGGWWTKTLASNYTTIIVGLAVLWDVAKPSPPNFLGLFDASTLHVSLKRNYSTGYIEAYNGNGTLLGTYNVVFSIGVWYYLELKVTIADGTSGSLQFRVNEYLALDLPGIDTRNAANAYVNKIGIGSNSYYAYNRVYIDDLYVCDTSGANNNDFLGDCRIDVVRPNGAGYATNWTPSAGSNYQCVDDALFDNGTDRVSENTVGDIDSYTFADLPVGIAGIKGIQTNVLTNRTDSGVATKIQPFIRPVATNYNKTEITPSISYYDHNEVTELNPETGAAWTKAELDAMEIGITLTANPLP